MHNQSLCIKVCFFENRTVQCASIDILHWSNRNRSQQDLHTITLGITQAIKRNIKESIYYLAMDSHLYFLYFFQNHLILLIYLQGKSRWTGQKCQVDKNLGTVSIILERKEILLCVWDVFSFNVI